VILKWLFGETYEPEKLQAQSLLEMGMPTLYDLGLELFHLLAVKINEVP
jgi:hypothetical protein